MLFLQYLNFQSFFRLSIIFFIFWNTKGPWHANLTAWKWQIVWPVLHVIFFVSKNCIKLTYVAWYNFKKCREWYLRTPALARRRGCKTPLTPLKAKSWLRGLEGVQIARLAVNVMALDYCNAKLSTTMRNGIGDDIHLALSPCSTMR